jgi:hypothetical protein
MCVNCFGCSCVLLRQSISPCTRRSLSVPHPHPPPPHTSPLQVCEVVKQLEGAYALLIKSALYPGQLVACRKGSPLILGIKHGAASQVGQGWGWGARRWMRQWAAAWVSCTLACIRLVPPPSPPPPPTHAPT